METILEHTAKATLDRMNPADRAAYDRALSRLNAVMSRRGLSRYEIAQQAGIPSPTLNPWMDGTTKGSYPNTTRKVDAFLQTLDDAETAAPAEPAGLTRPDFIETQAAKEIFTALTFAQNSPAMVLCTFGSGMGKTTAIKRFAATRANIVHVTLSPLTYAPFALQRAIADTAGIERQRGATLLQVIGNVLSEGGKKSLIVIDEAQYLKEKSINLLRYLYDVHRVGLALIGNEDIFRRLAVTASKEGAGQIQSRFRKRVHHLKPLAGDIKAYIDAWGIADPESRALLTAIGNKTGALRQISETLESALTAARGLGTDPTPDLIRAAWHDRTAEVLK